MALIIRSSEVQQNFGRVMDQALGEGDVIIERYGEPRVVMVAYGRYQQLLAAEQTLDSFYLAEPERGDKAKRAGRKVAKKVRAELADVEGTLEEAMGGLRGRRWS